MHNLPRLGNLSISVTLLIIANFPGAASAQNEIASSMQETSRETQFLEEIIVTATRREADVRSVPLSVHVITEEASARLGAGGFANYAPTVAGLSFTDGGTGGEKQTIRLIYKSWATYGAWSWNGWG